VQALVTLLQIFTFRKGPEDISYSSLMMALFLIISLFMKSIILAYSNTPLPWLFVVITYSFLAIFIITALSLRKHKERFVQTFTAAMGIELINLVLVEILLFLSIGTAVSLVILFLRFWTWAVLSNIMRQALEVSMVSAISMTLAFQVLPLLFTSILWEYL